MATRSNIRVIGKDTKVWVYRHWDGYPAGNGADLCKALRRRDYTGKPRPVELDGFLNTILGLRSPQQSYETEPRRVYEITTGEHGDIEWLYTFKFTLKQVRIEVREFKLREDKWIEHGSFSEKEFRSFVARDLLAMRKRIKDLKRRQAA